MNEKVPATHPWAIEASKLTKSFGHRHALRDINLRVSRGEHLVIFGPNGAGKTTLVRILSTLVKPSSGNVRLHGLDISEKPVQVRREIGVVSHQTFVYDNLTVYENLKFYGRMYDITDLEQQIRDVISQVHLESRLHDRVDTLSHGLRQRASLARSILHNPSILLLDEPEIGLDPHASIIIQDLLSDITADGRTVVMLTHNLERGLALADSVIILNRGRVVYQAPKQDIDTANFEHVYDRHTRNG